MPRVFKWRSPVPCPRPTSRLSVTPEPTSRVSARPLAATTGARDRWTRRGSVAWSRRVRLNDLFRASSGGQGAVLRVTSWRWLARAGRGCVRWVRRAPAGWGSGDAARAVGRERREGLVVDFYNGSG